MFKLLQQSRPYNYLGMLVMVLGVVSYFAAAAPVIAQNTPASNAPAATNASTKYDLTGKTGLVQCGNKTSDPCTVEDAFNIFIIATNLMIGAVGLIAIYGIIYAAFAMVRSDGNVETITAGKKGLTNSLVGLGMVLVAFIFVNLILYGLLGVKDQGVLKNPAGFIGGIISGNNPADNFPNNTNAPAGNKP